MDVESNVTPKQIEEYTRLGFWDRWTFCDFIKRWGAALPDKIALIDSKKRLTWSQYSRMVDRMALHFLDLGLKRGDLVIAQIPNSVEAVVMEFALARIGACVVPLPMPWREHELDFVLDQTEAPALITVPEYGGFNFLAMARNLQTRHPTIRQILLLGDNPAGREGAAGAVSLSERWDNPIEERYPQEYVDRNCRIDANLVLTMCYTSGTEAQPKGCPRTHNQWKCHVRTAVLNHLMENVNDRVVMALPWFNLFGQCIGILSMVLVGGTLILLDGFNPATMIQTIAQEKATVYAGVPAMHIAMLNYPKLAEYDMSSLRAVVSGGAPCPVAVIERMMKAYGCLTWNGFGSNEGYVSVAELGSPPQTISSTMGIRMLHADSKVVDKEGRRGGDRGVLPEGPLHHGRLLQAPGPEREEVGRGRLLPQRGCCLRGRTRLLPLRQPHLRHHHPLGDEHQRRGRGERVVPPPEGAQRSSGRHARPGAGRAGLRLHRAEGRHRSPHQKRGLGPHGGAEGGPLQVA
jgi:acyl-CoA synthetase (AMP-forming)/AMP-acid ligase II